MQMKIVVDTPEDYKKWLSSKTTLVQSVKKAATEEAATKAAEANPSKTDTTSSAKKDTTLVAVAPMK
jgi:cytochrome c oxidase subunit 2